MEKFKRKEGFTQAAQKKLGNTLVCLFRPDLSEQEREKRKKAIYRAVGQCFYK